MACFNYKSISLVVGWLNIVLCLALPIYVIGGFFIVLGDLRLVLQDSSFLELLPHLACVVPWLILSILLVKGIRQNRPKLVAPWLYISYVVIVVAFVYVIRIGFVMAQLGGLAGGILESLVLGIPIFILILCVIPVAKLHKQMCIPPPILPTERPTETKKPEDHPRYIPVFDN